MKKLTHWTLVLLSGLTVACTSTPASSPASGWIPVGTGPSLPGSLVWVVQTGGFSQKTSELRMLRDGTEFQLDRHTLDLFPFWLSDGRLSVVEDSPGRLIVLDEPGGKSAALPPGLEGPGLSPDGTRYLQTDSGAGALVIRSAKGGGEVSRFLVPGYGTRKGDYPNLWIEPVWSPRGDRLVYGVTTGQDKAELYACNLDGTDRIRLNGGLEQGWGARWSPSGDRVAFYAQGGIWVVGADGAGLHRVSSPGVFAAFATWSPDGSLLAYHAGGGEDLDLWVSDPEGGQAQIVAGGPGRQFQPAWGP